MVAQAVKYLVVICLAAAYSVRAITNQDSIKLIGGVELVNSEKGIGDSRSDSVIEAEVLENEETGDLEKREVILEQFIADKISEVVNKRSLRLSTSVSDVTNAMQGLAHQLPYKMGRALAEGRAKKILKALLPLVLGLKLKVVGFLLLSYLAIALMAKQATVAAIISLGISTFAAIRSFLAHRQPHYSEHHIGVPHIPSFGHASHAGLDLSDFSAQSFIHSSPYGAYKPLASHK